MIPTIIGCIVLGLAILFIMVKLEFSIGGVRKLTVGLGKLFSLDLDLETAAPNTKLSYQPPSKDLNHERFEPPTWSQEPIRRTPSDPFMPDTMDSEMDQVRPSAETPVNVEVKNDEPN